MRTRPKTYRFSPSSLSLLRECPRCFWLDYVKGIERPAMVFPSLPGGMDLLIKRYFDSFRAKGRLPHELEGLKGVKLFDDMEKLKAWRNNFRGLRWSDRAGNVLRGALDEVLEKSGRLIVLDFKTRGFPLKSDPSGWYQDQLDIYTFLLRKNGYRTEDYAFLLFFHPEKVLSSGIRFRSELVRIKVRPQNAQKLLRKALEVLGGKMPKPGEECGFCAWAEKYMDEVF